MRTLLLLACALALPVYGAPAFRKVEVRRVSVRTVEVESPQIWKVSTERGAKVQRWRELWAPVYERFHGSPAFPPDSESYYGQMYGKMMTRFRASEEPWWENELHLDQWNIFWDSFGTYELKRRERREKIRPRYGSATP